MRFSSSESAGKRRNNKKVGNFRGRKKHKRLDAICEEAYTRNHSGVDRAAFVEENAESKEADLLRRSSRVRRAPVVLDASPAPPKKRRKVDKKGKVNSVDRGKRVVELKSEFPTTSTVRRLVKSSISWRSRLRSRRKRVSFESRENGDSKSKGKRKLFEDFDAVKEESELGILNTETEDEEEKFVDETSNAQPLEAGKLLSSPENEDEENELCGGMGDGEQPDEEETVDFSNERTDLLLGIQNGHVESDHRLDDGAELEKFVEEEKLNVQTSPKLEEHHQNDGSENLERGILPEKVCIIGEGPIDTQEIVAVLSNAEQAKDEGYQDESPEDGICEKFNENQTNHTSDFTLRPVHMKEGRRCGLCGGGTDGKPPKKRVQDGTFSDNEVYSGGSASEEPNYDVWDGFGDEPGWLGRLLGPINDRFGIAGIWVHQQCAVWSPEVYFAGLGCLKNVRAALCRGRALKCTRCGRPGATIGCRVDRCPKTYHLPCARDCGSIFDHRKFLIACKDHRNLFQPHGSQYVHRLRKLKAKKMKLDMRKISNDALRKDFEAEEKWLENCGEDEEFLKRESKRLHRDLSRIAPVYIGGGNCDSGMQFQGWESVAGLQDVIQCMKEVVILPLLYPEFFSNIGLTPPRGVLLHGHPGTGKTLVVRALIGSCARGDKKIAYFARKGADCLGKYVGDAERQLRLLFQVAEKSQPSIIFFDEIDGLAPCRSRQQDQTHSSVVSTLLALMDGLKSRGSVVVIGATNRPDAVDPALRRPGRFDREIYFPLPALKDREAILSLHTQKWPKPISGSLLKWVARRTGGFAGADLQALCTQAAIRALSRSFPLKEILSSGGEKAHLSKQLLLPSFTVEERDWLDAISSAPPPCSRREAGIAANDMVSSPLALHLVPCLLKPMTKLLASLYLDDRLWLPPSLSKAAMLIKSVIASALDKEKVHYDNWWASVDDLLQKPDVLGEIEDNLTSATNLTEYTAGHLDTYEDFADNGYLKFKPSRVQRIGACPGLLHTFVDESGKKPGFHLLISGKPRSGQRHLASCLLHCFVGNVEHQKLDLATMSQEGHGDVVQGLTQILMRCSNMHPCIVFLPRIDLWAMETHCLSYDDESFSPGCTQAEEFAEIPETKDAVKTASYLWNSFIEQVKSMHVCASLMILATSEVPFLDLPCRIRQFFSSEMLNNSFSSRMKATVPQFVVEVDENLDHDMVIETSAAKLSKDIVGYFVQLVHQGNHKQSSLSGEKNLCESFEGNIGTLLRSNPGTATGDESKYPCAPVTSLTPRNPVKGKPNLMIAISSFGYQILRYPHFAELCWFTSKLKEGPCTHINGSWKGWPFNSCIGRPVDALESVTVTCGSNITRSKEKSCIVRGLTAIGLSAYRGEYTSLREISLEVRKVLELLVGCINDKIEAGKDKYRFFRLLSQVAYFEDMVSSWVYTLRSFEADGQVLVGSPRRIGTESLINHTTCNGNLHEQDVPLQDAPKPDANIIEHPDLRVDSDLMSRSRDDEIATLVEEPLRLGLLVHSATDDGLMQNGLDAETNMETDETQNEVGGGGCIKDLNALMQRNDDALLRDDKCVTELSDKARICSQGIGNLSLGNDSQLGSSTRNYSGFPASMSVCLPNESGIVCIYECCSHCLVNLRQLLLKILKNQQNFRGSNLTAEDFHDLVCSLSANLLSATRKLFTPSHGCDEKLMKLNESKYFPCQGVCDSECTRLSKGLMPINCGCHSEGDGLTRREPDFLKNPRNGCDLKLIFRDSVLLAHVDADQDASFHCKFEKLCLCSLVESIVTCEQESLNC